MSETTENTNHKYLALTIGPIGKTLSNARKTRELWAASYIFSYLMKEIIREIRENKAYTFIIPNVEGKLKEAFEKAKGRSELYKNGAGLFPDRLIVKIPDNEEGALERLNIAVEEVLKKLGEKIEIHINSGYKKEVIEYVKSYFQVYQLEVDIPTNDNPILTIQPYLDSLELQRNYAVERKNYLEDFFDLVTKSFLIQDGWNEDEYSFESIIEVAVKQFEPEDIDKQIESYFEGKITLENMNPLAMVKAKRIRNQAAIRTLTNYKARRKKSKELNKLAINDENIIISHLSKEYDADSKTPFKTAHKYIAIVQADGDNVGNLIKELGNQDLNKLEGFSQKLSEFAAEAVGQIAAYGGMPIYAGGDDLLFFAPVINAHSNLQNTTHIFDLLKKLDDGFKALFKDFGISPNPSLSFGLSISYYKFPLYEALKEAQHLLFGVAKNTTGKNAISFKVLKHSGQYFEANMQIPKDSFKKFDDLLDKAVKNPGRQLSSIMYRLQENEAILKAIGKDKTAVTNFIGNSFDEDIHKQTEQSMFLKDIACLIPIVYQENSDADAANRQLYSMLRTIAFLTSTNSND